MTDAFVAAYMQACKDRPTDHNEIGLWYFRKAWEAASELEREVCAKTVEDLPACLYEAEAFQEEAVEYIRARSSVADTPVER